MKTFSFCIIDFIITPNPLLDINLKKIKLLTQD